MAHRREVTSLLIAGLSLVIMASSFTTFVVTASKQLSDVGLETDSELPVRLSQAYPVCDYKLKEKFGDRMVTKTFDNNSTRLDRGGRFHLLYAFVDVVENGIVEQFYASCKVSAVNNKLWEFKVSQR